MPFVLGCLFAWLLPASCGLPFSEGSSVYIMECSYTDGGDSRAELSEVYDLMAPGPQDHPEGPNTQIVGFSVSKSIL